MEEWNPREDRANSVFEAIESTPSVGEAGSVLLEETGLWEWSPSWTREMGKAKKASVPGLLKQNMFLIRQVGVQQTLYCSANVLLVWCRSQ